MTCLSTVVRLLHLCLCFTGWRLSSASSEWQAPQPIYNVPQDSYSSSQLQQQQQQQQLYYDSVEQQVTIPLQDIEMNLEHISLSLRLTCEMNRRLLQGIRSNNDLAVVNHNDAHKNSNHLPLLQQRGGGGGGDNSYHPVHVHPSQSWQPPIKSHCKEDEEEVLTIFHAKSPRTQKDSRGSSSIYRGVARWGPELLPYLQYLVEDVFKLSENKNERSLIFALSLLYLDRACSVETPRSSSSNTGQQQQQQNLPCPFLQPRTVHRLVLISLLFAARSVVGDNCDYTMDIEKLLGIPSLQLKQMESYFHNALGDLGLFVDPIQLQQWMMRWQHKFTKSRRVAY